MHIDHVYTACRHYRLFLFRLMFWAISDFALDLALVNIKKSFSKKGMFAGVPRSSIGKAIKKQPLLTKSFVVSNVYPWWQLYGFKFVTLRSSLFSPKSLPPSFLINKGDKAAMRWRCWNVQLQYQFGFTNSAAAAVLIMNESCVIDTSTSCSPNPTIG